MAKSIQVEIVERPKPNLYATRKFFRWGFQL